MASRTTYVQTTALSSLPWFCASGSPTSEHRPPILTGSPWENGYCESFNSKLRDELLNVGIFYSLREAEVLIESWRRHFNTVRPHSSLGYVPPAPEAILPCSGTVALWPGAPASEGAPPANPTVAPKPVLH